MQAGAHPNALKNNSSPLDGDELRIVGYLRPSFMNHLSVNNLSKSFGTKTLFKNISFGVTAGEKVALVARNGSGKTTLFKILRGIEIADSGETVFRKDIQVAFLDQDFVLAEEATIQQVLDSADNPCTRAIRAYDAAIHAQENGTAHADALDEALEVMNATQAWEYQKTMAEILGRLEIVDLSQKIAALSGGQKKRVALALVLINKPDFVVMDEPTNHLDLEMIGWLAHYLSNAQLSLLLVTHDRYFLDEVCDRILELDHGDLFEYRGDFEYYLTKKAEREAAFASETDKARNLFKRELEWVRRMPKARGTKSKSRLDAFEEIKAKALRKKPVVHIEMSVKSERLGSKILELHKITKAFGSKKILEPFSYTFIPGEKIGIAGKNGTGKTTLLRMMLGMEMPDSGKVVSGDTVVFGYYSQAGIKLDNDKRIIEVIKEIAEFIPLANGTSLSASQLLTRFNFAPDVQYSYVSKLSGGERRRLYLLTVLVRNPNFLVLDEPTNDLDILTLQTLEEFLLEFKGCVIIVSHDRYFMDKLVDHLFVLEGDGVLKDFPGNYSEYRIWKQNQKDEVVETISPPTEIETVKVSAPVKKRSYKVQRELEELEAQITALEQKKKELELKLAEGINDYNEITKLSDLLKSVTNELDEKSLRWLELDES